MKKLAYFDTKWLATMEKTIAFLVARHVRLQGWIMCVHEDARHADGYTLQFPSVELLAPFNGSMAVTLQATMLANDMCRELKGDPGKVTCRYLGPTRTTTDRYFISHIEDCILAETSRVVTLETADLWSIARFDPGKFQDQGVAFDRAVSLMKRQRG